MDRNEQGLSEQGFLILLALAEGPQHGYALLGSVERLSEGRVVISTGTLYGAIRRFLDAGWIRRSADPDPDNATRERQAYELTADGRRVVDGELRRLENLTRVARVALASEPARSRR